jgi:transcriptional regulator with PAS, ATPase and Fis domain
MNIWSDDFDGSVTVCDLEGKIVYINKVADKGRNLLGSNLLDCHPEPSRSKLVEMLKTPTYNTYTTEKNGIRRMVHQTPHFTNGEFSGIVEISFLIPQELTNKIR